jgi:hypothetical protein
VQVRRHDGVVDDRVRRPVKIVVVRRWERLALRLVRVVVGAAGQEQQVAVVLDGPGGRRRAADLGRREKGKKCELTFSTITLSPTLTTRTSSSLISTSPTRAAVHWYAAGSTASGVGRADVGCEGYARPLIGKCPARRGIFGCEGAACAHGCG